MDPKTLYVCKHCGKQMLELDETNILKIVVNMMMFSGYAMHCSGLSLINPEKRNSMSGLWKHPHKYLV